MSTDNSAPERKVLIRARLAAQFPSAQVLDCYSGTGVMAREAWAAHKVTRIDRKRLPGIAHVGDNLRIAPTLAASGAFTLIDLDAYGNPWPLWDAIADALPAGRYGIAVTCGIKRNLIAKTQSRWIAQRVGIPTRVPLNLAPFYEDLIRMVITSGPLHIERVEWMEPRGPGLSVRYWGIVANKKARSG